MCHTRHHIPKKHTPQTQTLQVVTSATDTNNTMEMLLSCATPDSSPQQPSQPPLTPNPGPPPCTNGVLDITGTCCTGATLDACGVCNGTAVAVDIAGTCCTGPLDGAGRCCDSSAIDACGVCLGDGSTCSLALLLAVDLGSSEQAGALTAPAVQQLAVGHVIKALQLPASAIQSSGVQMPGGHGFIKSAAADGSGGVDAATMLGGAEGIAERFWEGIGVNTMDIGMVGLANAIPTGVAGIPGVQATTTTTTTITTITTTTTSAAAGPASAPRPVAWVRVLLAPLGGNSSNILRAADVVQELMDNEGVAIQVGKERRK